MRRRAAIFALPLAAYAQQSAITPAGPQAHRINDLFWFFFVVLAVVFILVMAATAWAVFRRDRRQGQERGARRAVVAATVTTVVIILVFLVSSVATGRAVSNTNGQPNALAVEVNGSQWWWYVRYLNDNASLIAVTANEIHIPVGRPVMIRGTSHDVIHSFWVPELHGKIDLIPSRVTTLWIQADYPGRYRGQCAEFCGIQHAHMALWVIADEPAQFEQWIQHQRQPAAEPATASAQHGRDVFLSNGCVLCHNVTGTTAGGAVAPDLTHVGSRTTIAAGTLQNTRGNLGGWILDPQGNKPGNHMAQISLKSEDVDPLLDYLESLK